MAKKRAKKSKAARKAAKKDTTLELTVPDELYKTVAEMDAETLNSILQSVLGGQARFGIDKVVIKPKSKKIEAEEIAQFSKPC